MHVCVNDLSFVGQAATPHDASGLMKQLADLLRGTTPMRGADPVCTRGDFWAARLCNNFTVNDWLSTPTVHIDERRIFLLLAKNGPFVEALLREKGIECRCEIRGVDIAFSSISGAAHFGGICASLRDSGPYSDPVIEVRRCSDPAVMLRVDNFTEADGLARIRRRYSPSRKHEAGGWGTEMDLDDETAQAVLDRGCQVGKQVYGVHDDHYYEFQPDNAGGLSRLPDFGNSRSMCRLEGASEANGGLI